MNENVLTFPGLKKSIAEIIKEEVKKAKEESFMKIFELHVRALSCHCECLGMNAENCIAACKDNKVPFNSDGYQRAMKKWGLVNDEGKPTI